MNIVDKAIGFFSPKAAFERERFRMAQSILVDQQRKYNAASNGRRTDGWVASGTSQNAEAELSLHKLRERSRDLVRNFPYAARAIDAIESNTIGTGIRPRPNVEKGRAKQRIVSAWKDWAESTECDFDGVHDFYGLQGLVMRTVAESGEAIIRKRRTGKYKLQLQVVEGDYIDTNKNGTGADGSRWVQGVEFDAKGNKVAYWMFDQHPGDTFRMFPTSQRYPISEFTHVYMMKRPEQVRGTPFGVASMMRMFDFDEYEDAQLIRQKIAACFAVFVNSTGDGLVSGSKNADRAGQVEPGMIEYLAPGQTMSFAAPPPAEGYDEYTRTLLRGIAAGYGITYEVLTGDYSNVNFSSGRMGWIEMHRNIYKWQSRMMIPMFCNVAWEWFTTQMFIAGKISSPVTASWTTPSREMIDPTKEIAAAAEAVRNGFKSRSSVIREHGSDPEEVLQEIVDDNASADKDELKFDSDSRFRTGVKAVLEAPAEVQDTE